MSQVKLQAFIADVTALKQGSRFYHPSINIDDRFGRDTSVKGLINYLRGHFVAAQPMTLSDAVAHCVAPTDNRIVKYMPAIERLVACWGRAAPYPAIVASTDARNQAMWKFAVALRNWPLPLQAALPSWDDLEADAADAFAFGHHLGPGYLHRVLNPPNPPLDITARSLLLRAGLAPAVAITTDRGYVTRLGLTQAQLNRMRNRSILDVACGGALFGAEMAVEFGCATDGMDLNAMHVPAAVAEGQRRYARSMMYLKMLKDRGTAAVAVTPAWSGPLIDRLVARLPAILAQYAANLPQAGNILAAPGAFQLAANAIRAGGWDYTTCMYLLCYFNNADQTAAVLNMCSVTARTVFLFSGEGAVANPQLGYNQAAVQAAYPNCRIEVINAQTHHIHM